MTYVMVCKDHSTINAEWNEDHNGFKGNILTIKITIFIYGLLFTFYDINDIKLTNHAYVMRSVEIMIMGRLQTCKSRTILWLYLFTDCSTSAVWRMLCGTLKEPC